MLILKKKLGHYVKSLLWPSEKIPVPVHISLELTTACNYSCQYCAVSLPNYRANKIQKDKAFKIIDGLVEIGYKRGAIQLNGHGESTILPWFEELLSYIRKKLPNIDINFHTNGSYLDSLAEAIIKYRVHHISVSVDAGTQDIFDEIRGQGSFKSLISGLNAIKEQKHIHNTKYPNLWFVATLMKTNVFDLEQLVKLAVQYQVTEVVTQALTPYQNLNTQDLALRSLPTESHQEVYEIIKRAKEYAKQHNMVMRLLNEDPFNEPQPEWHTQAAINKAQAIENANCTKTESIPKLKKIYRDCTDPWKMLYINARGSFDTCCFRHNDVKEQLDNCSLMDIWYHSEGLNQVRENLLQGQLDHICANCPTRPIVDHPPNIPKQWHV